MDNQMRMFVLMPWNSCGYQKKKKKSVYMEHIIGHSVRVPLRRLSNN